MDLREANNTKMLLEERQHWWIVTRFYFIERALKNLSGTKLKLVEFGCGTGQNLWWLRTQSLSKNRILTLTGVDPNLFGETRQDWQTSNDKLVKEINSKDSFDGLLAMDVLEHIDDDLAALNSWVASLTTNGWVFLAVPAFNFLWSGHDEFLGHKRRYTRSQLDQLAQQAGLIKIESFYAFSFVFPLVWIIRRLIRGKQTASDLRPPLKPVNCILKFFGQLEAKLGGFPFFGTSVMGVYRKL